MNMIKVFIKGQEDKELSIIIIVILSSASTSSCLVHGGEVIAGMTLDETDSSWQRATLLFFDVIRPPELLQFVDDVIPVLHGERTHSRRSVAYPLPFPHHHDCHSDVVVGAIDIRVPKSITQVERLAFSTFLQVIANLGGTLHIQDERLTFISFNQLGENLLAIAFAS